MFEKLKAQIDYAKTSCEAREMLYKALGAINMAYELNAITKEEALRLHNECVAEGINNPKYF